MEDASRAAQDVTDISFARPEDENCSGMAKPCLLGRYRNRLIGTDKRN